MVAAFALSAACTATSSARANGRFPSANLVVFDPGDPSHVAVSTNFGLIESRDRGKTFGWICESALGIAGQEDTMIAITKTGAIVAATFDGIVRSDDGCSFAPSTELAGQIVPDLSLSPSAPDEVLAFRTMGLGSDQYDSQIVESIDDGRTWTNVGGALPLGLFPLSIDIAPTDRSRVYLSGRLGATDGYASVLMRSIDGGATFERTIVPETDVLRMAYVAAVHPLDADKVYVRVDDTAGTVVWSSDDGGKTLRRRFTGTARVLGFAVSPDGARIALGGPNDGTWVGPTDGATFERRSDVGSSCLAWNAAGLYACADARQAGFSVGLSRDEASSFEPLLEFASLCGRTACGSGTDVGKLCPAAFMPIAATLGARCDDAGAPDAAMDVGDREAGSGRAGAPNVGDASGGCSFVAAGVRPYPWRADLSFAALLCLHARRARSSRSRRPGPCSRRSMHIRRAAAATALLMTVGIAAYAVPRTGDRFPTLTAEDLTGQAHSTDELKGRRALVVAITDKNAAGAAHAWFVSADSQIPANVARESLVSLHLPFFVSTSTAQNKAREQVPRQHWQATLLDRGDMARQLGLEDGQVPYVFALDENGHILAAVRGTVDSSQAETIWNAFGEH